VPLAPSAAWAPVATPRKGSEDALPGEDQDEHKGGTANPQRGFGHAIVQVQRHGGEPVDHQDAGADLVEGRSHEAIGDPAAQGRWPARTGGAAWRLVRRARHGRMSVCGARYAAPDAIGSAAHPAPRRAVAGSRSCAGSKRIATLQRLVRAGSYLFASAFSPASTRRPALPQGYRRPTLAARGGAPAAQAGRGATAADRTRALRAA